MEELRLQAIEAYRAQRKRPTDSQGGGTRRRQPFLVLSASATHWLLWWSARLLASLLRTLFPRPPLPPLPSCGDWYVRTCGAAHSLATGWLSRLDPSCRHNVHSSLPNACPPPHLPAAAGGANLSSLAKLVRRKADEDTGAAKAGGTMHNLG